ncbi:MAG: hypothetical protein ACRD88_04280, partial [Terriglobia bacterium]
MGRAASWSWKASLILAFAGYQFLAHFAISNSQAGRVYLFLALSLLVVLAWWGVRNSRNKQYW